MSSPVWKCFSLITSSSVIMSSPVWKCSRSLRHHLWSCLHRSGSGVRSLRHHLWSCLRRSGSGVLAHYVIICDHVFAGLEVVSRSLRHHLWSCLHRSGSVSLITSSSVIMSSPVWKCFSLITSSSVIMSSPVWKCVLAHYVIICDHVFTGLEVFLAHYVIICDHVFAGLEVFSLITSSSVIMSSPVWKCFSLITSSSVIMSSPVWKWCRAHYVIICDHVFAGLEVVSRSLRHHLWSCLRRSGSVSRSLRHHLWSCLRRLEVFLAHYFIICDHVFAGLEVFPLITSSSVIMSSPVWKCVPLITSSSVIMSSPVWRCRAHYVIICDHVFAGLEVVSRSLRHHLWSCLRRSGSGSRSLRHHLWSCLRRSGSVSLITSSSVIMSSPVWKCFSLITSSSVIMSPPVWKWCLAHYVIICDHVFAGLEVVSAHYVIICDHVFAGLEVFLGGRGGQFIAICNACSARLREEEKKASRFNTTNLIYRLKRRHRSCIKGL